MNKHTTYNHPFQNISIRLILCIALCSWTLASEASALPSDSCERKNKIIHHIGFDAGGSYVGSSHNVVDHYYGNGATILHTDASAHLKYSFSYSETTPEGRLYPGAYQGLGISSTSFSNDKHIGTPVSVYLFQGASLFRLAKNLTFGYEWNFGASFGWKKYNETNPPVNLIVGSKTNAYINLGFRLDYRLSNYWNLRAGIDMTHWSNGNTSWPNPGVNAIGGRVGMVYTFNGQSRSTTLFDSPDLSPVKPHFSYDLVLYGAARKRTIFINDSPELLPGHFGIAGLNFAPMYNFNRFFRAGISADIQYDESSDLEKYWVEGTYGNDIKFSKPSFFHQVSAGLSARGELVMPIFSINAGFGYNILANPDDRHFYQILALKVHIVQSLFLHIGYQLNSFRNPNNLMIGIGYRFNDQR